MTVRVWAKRCSGAGFVILNLIFFVLWMIGANVLKKPFDSAVGLLGLLVTVEALLVTTLVLNSQERESTRQDKRAASQYENVIATVDAVDHVQAELTQLRADLQGSKTAVVADNRLMPPTPIPQTVTLGIQEKAP